MALIIRELLFFAQACFMQKTELLSQIKLEGGERGDVEREDFELGLLLTASSYHFTAK
jgi:hypothetical protein